MREPAGAIHRGELAIIQRRFGKLESLRGVFARLGMVRKNPLPGYTRYGTHRSPCLRGGSCYVEIVTGRFLILLVLRMNLSFLFFSFSFSFFFPALYTLFYGATYKVRCIYNRNMISYHPWYPGHPELSYTLEYST